MRFGAGGRPVFVLGTATVGLAVLLALTFKDARGGRRELQKVHDKVAELNAQVADLVEQNRTALKLYQNTNFAYAETPDGLDLVRAEAGISKADLDFVRRFRKPLLPSDSDLGDLPVKLRATLDEDYPHYRDLIAARLPDLSERERYIAYALARTHGSLPTYVVRNTVPDDLRHIVMGLGGNCSDVSLRMMMVAEALGLKAMSITIFTKSVPGHIVVDTYDPQSNASYILDATFNIMAISRDTDGKSVLEGLFLAGGDAASKIELIQLPSYFRFVDPGEGAFGNGAVTARSLNYSRGAQLDKWRAFLSSELDELRTSWENKGDGSIHRPNSLPQWREYLTAIPAEFNASRGFENGLRAAAGIAPNAVNAGRGSPRQKGDPL